MPSTDFQKIFLDSASEVLETMFFTDVEGETMGDPPAQRISAELEFVGAKSGKFGVQVSREAGREIAANFLGLDEVSPEQVIEVVCELSNMLCGSVLSRVEEGARFELSHPEVDIENVEWHGREDAIGYTFGIGEGAITMWLALQNLAAVSPAA